MSTLSATGHTRENGVLFDDLDVARCYAHRAPYAPALYDHLLTLVPGRTRALDLGCGPGKIAKALAPHFQTVEALDPSAAMIAIGREDAPPNVDWITAGAEVGIGTGPYDLVTAGASLHWMDHSIVFPKLAACLEPGGVMAIINGDDAFDPPWAEEMKDFLTRWLARLGRTYSPAAFNAELTSYQRWFDIQGEQGFTYEHTETIAGYIACQHSRATWTRTVMGEKLAHEFDEDLALTLAPFTRAGRLHFQVKSSLVWGTPRTTLS
ncbi:MAG TPA: class I SAM-dependent methyltransferase [Rhizomicrobium sp.]|jgi:trans-aconitate methyltransferase|nr:class I SAM-dependent methyltransferase [Rhizomicrobium sp.]